MKFYEKWSFRELSLDYIGRLYREVAAKLTKEVFRKAKEHDLSLWPL